MTFVNAFWEEEQGQDLIEYTLLIAFIAFASALVFTNTGQSMRNIQSTVGRELDSANELANGS